MTDYLARRTLIAVCAFVLLALLTGAEARAATVTVGVDMSHPGADASLVQRDFVGVAIPYYLVPSMLSYSPLNVAAHRRFALPWPAPPLRVTKVLAMLAAGSRHAAGGRHRAGADVLLRSAVGQRLLFSLTDSHAPLLPS